MGVTPIGAKEIMFKFYSRTLRVNEMGGKLYVEVKDKRYDFPVEGVVRSDKPVVDSVSVKVFDTAEDLNDYFNKAIG